MNEFIVMGLAVVLILIILSVVFVKDAIKSHREQKKVKLCMAVICGVITIVPTLYLIYTLCFSLWGSLTSIASLMSILIIPMIWVACFFVNRRIMRIFLIFLSLISFGVFVMMLTAVQLGNVPMNKSDAKYTTQEEVEKLLNMDNLPKLMYDDATEYVARNTYLALENPADSTKLMNVFKQLCNTHNLQCSEKDKVYYTVNNENSTYANVYWEKKGIIISYGHIFTYEKYKEFFDSLQAPIPAYEIIQNLDTRIGPDMYHHRRVRFKESVSQSWLYKVKKAIQKNDAWSYKEEYNKIIIDIPSHDGHYYTLVIYKNYYGKRKIADISWGNF